MKRPRLLALVGLAVLASLGVACLSDQGPSGWAGPVRLGDVTMVSTRDGRLDAVDSNDRALWRFPDFWAIPDGSDSSLDGIYGKPVIGSFQGEDIVFVGDFNGFVYAFRPGDVEDTSLIGEPPAAAFELGDAVIGGMTLDAGADILYVTAGSKVFSLTASDLVARIDNPASVVRGFTHRDSTADSDSDAGVLFEAGDEIWGEPVLVADRLLVSSLDGNLYAIDTASGEAAWQFTAEQGLVSTPALAGDLVLVAGFGSKLFGVDLADGSLRWEFKAEHWIWGQPAVDGDVAYVGDFESVVHAVNLNSGTEAWSLPLERGELRASPAIESGTLIVSSDDGWLVGIDLATRDVAWERNLDTKMNADLRALQGEVLLAPRGCVRPEGSDNSIYYTKVNPRNGDLSFTAGVC